MSELPRGVCPLCGAPRAADGAPACACARLASDAHRSDRTAQAAAAEDFDPVRIRPFVVLGDDREPRDGEDLENPAVPARTAAPGPGEPPPTDPDRAADDTTDDGADDTADSDRSGAEPAVPDASRRGRARLLLLAGALAVAVAAAVLAGLLAYDGPARDGSPAEGVRAPVPDVTSEGAAASGRPSPQASRTQPSPTPSGSAGPSATVSATASRSTAPSSAPSAGAPGAPGATPSRPGPGPAPSAPPVLRLGDTGPEVAELQMRLRQIGYYDAEADGVYSRQVQAAVGTYQLTRAVLGDESGVYGAATRASLEAETDEP